MPRIKSYDHRPAPKRPKRRPLPPVSAEMAAKGWGSSPTAVAARRGHHAPKLAGLTHSQRSELSRALNRALAYLEVGKPDLAREAANWLRNELATLGV